LDQRRPELAPFDQMVLVLRGVADRIEALEGVRIDRATELQLDAAWALFRAQGP
jgi:hypothetical protein